MFPDVGSLLVGPLLLSQKIEDAVLEHSSKDISAKIYKRSFVYVFFVCVLFVI